MLLGNTIQVLYQSGDLFKKNILLNKKNRFHDFFISNTLPEAK